MLVIALVIVKTFNIKQTASPVADVSLLFKRSMRLLTVFSIYQLTVHVIIDRQLITLKIMAIDTKGHPNLI